jgi:hypothetical protein
MTAAFPLVLNANTTNDSKSDNLTEWEMLIVKYNLRPLSPGGYIGCAIYLVIVGKLFFSAWEF